MEANDGNTAKARLMKVTKEGRQSAILSLIESEPIETQEVLTTRLREMGIAATQATISRDMRELALQKEQTRDGGYRYAVSSVKKADMRRLAILLDQTVESMARAQNIVVIKTTPGAAHTAGEAVDNLNMPEIVGCLAGDNTCIVITRYVSDVGLVMNRLEELMASASVPAPVH